MKDLTNLRKIAEAATPGEWWTKQFEPNVCDIFAGDGAGDNPGVAEAWHPEDATHIATFDPPTVLELLNRLEQAERDLVVVRESQKKIAKQFAAMGTEKGKAEWRAREAEAAVARVREVATGAPTEYGWSEAMFAVLRALDGEQS